MKQVLFDKFIIDDKIEKVEQPYKNILFYRYTKGMSWNKVAEKMGYTREYVCVLHGDAFIFLFKNLNILQNLTEYYY